MPAIEIADYDDLIAAAADWLNRQDLTDQIPAFVRFAESQFNRELRVRDMMVRAYTTSANELVELPDDWLEHYSLTTADGGVIEYMTEANSNRFKGDGMAGETFGYTVVGNAIELVPAPGADMELRMVYYARIPHLGPTQPSNWLLAKYPDVYLYSVLLQAMPYLKDDARLATWIQLRAGMIESLETRIGGRLAAARRSADCPRARGGRRRTTAPGLAQPHRQRLGSDPERRRRCTHPHPGPLGRGPRSRLGEGGRRGQRPGHPPRPPATHLRTLLHDETGGEWVRTLPGVGNPQGARGTPDRGEPPGGGACFSIWLAPAGLPAMESNPSHPQPGEAGPR